MDPESTERIISDYFPDTMALVSLFILSLSVSLSLSLESLSYPLDANEYAI
jgi:hypothetical protein